MTAVIDFDQYWGVRLSGIHFDCQAMSISIDMHWTTDSLPYSACLRFAGVLRFAFDAEKVFDSDVVELISLTGERVRGGWRIVGEMSNYDFEIHCANVLEQEK